MKPQILVVDKEVVIRDALKMILEHDGCDCLLASNGQEALECAERDSLDLLILDVMIPGMDGLDVLRRFRQLDELLPVVMISAHGTVSAAVEATKLGAFDFLEKPFSTERVKVMTRNALDQRRLRDENHSWRQAAAGHTLREFKEASERKFLVGKLAITVGIFPRPR